MLMPGHQGRVSNATPDPNRVRSEPNAQADLLGEIPAGAYFDVLEGPRCADDSAWFRVRYESIEGWMKEGSSSEYWVMPIVDDARILTGPSIVAAGYNINLPGVLGTSAQILDLPYDATDNTPPVTFLRLTEYRFYDYSASIFIYNVEEYLYYRADLRSRLEGIRMAINSLLSDPDAQISWPEFQDPFIQEQTYLIQAGRFSNGWALRGVSVMEDDPSTPYYVFLGFTSDMQSLFYVKLPIRLTFGQLAESISPDNFSPIITQVDTLLLFQPYTRHSSLSDPTLAGTCPGAPPFTLMVGDWARVSVDPPAPSRIRSGPSSNNQVLGEAQPGENLLVIDGPQCANGYTWGTYAV
jgi:hypothetical protein